MSAGKARWLQPGALIRCRVPELGQWQQSLRSGAGVEAAGEGRRPEKGSGAATWVVLEPRRSSPEFRLAKL